MTAKKLAQYARASHARTAPVRTAAIAARKARDKSLLTKGAIGILRPAAMPRKAYKKSRTIVLSPEDFTQEAREAFQKLAADPKKFKRLLGLLVGGGAHLAKDRKTVKSAAAAIVPETHAAGEVSKGRAPGFTDSEVDLLQAADRLAEMDLHLRANAVTSSQAKDQWPTIARDAEQGVLTPIERRGGATLVVVPAEKLAQMAAQVPSELTFGDLLRNHPGVRADAVPRPRSSGGPVTRLRLPTGKPTVKS